MATFASFKGSWGKDRNAAVEANVGGRDSLEEADHDHSFGYP